MNKKRYIAVWHNTSTNNISVEHIFANDISEAKLIMVYLMKYYGGPQYEAKDIEYIEEEQGKFYIDYKSILNKYNMARKPIPKVFI